MEFDYILTTDSDAEMPFSWLDEFDIKAILMPYSIDGEEKYFDFFRDYDDHAFYEKMKAGAKITTAQRNPQDFKEFWEPWLKQGKDILYVGLSSELSGTFNSATIAKQELKLTYPDRKIILVDTLKISAPQAMLVRAAGEKRLAGMPIDEVAAYIEAIKKKVTAFFVVDDLTYLKRGGRVSATTAFFGTMLDIKPVLYESPRGKLEPFDKAKGRKKAVKMLLELCGKYADDLQNNYMIICQADCGQDAKLLEGILQEQMNPKKIYTQSVGPVIGGHAGPGVIAVCFFANTENIEPEK